VIHISKSFKLKLILGGTSGSGKTSFINGSNENDWPIGVSFKSVECYANENDSYKFLVWDLKDQPRFRFMFKDFCRGACAGLICFDLSNRSSFNELKRWIETVRKGAGDVPIILIGTKKDLDNREIKENEIIQFVEENHLETVFFTSIYEDQDSKEEIFEYLVRLIDPDYPLENFSIIPRELEDEDFKKFLENFSTCPICKSQLHYETIKGIYFSNDINSIQMRNKLLNLMDELYESENKHFQNIFIGIPCCRCYKKLFPL